MKGGVDSPSFILYTPTKSHFCIIRRKKFLKKIFFIKFFNLYICLFCLFDFKFYCFLFVKK